MVKAQFPKVSVCMISYNHGRYIGQAIESILQQDIAFPIELVIGDDCSTDDTAQICEKYASRDSRIRILSRERNLGVMPNFSRTLLACRGEYVAVCEGDDYWTDPLKLTKQVAFLDANPDYAGAAHQSDVLVNECFSRKFKTNVPLTLMVDDLIGGRMFHTASIIFRRPAVDLFCRAPLVLSCDRLLNLVVANLGKIRYSDESMCAYRIHNGGMSSNVTAAQLKLDLNSVIFLKLLQPKFPKYRYKSYIYATIGLCQLATPVQRFCYLLLSFVFSFSNFPYNLKQYGFHFLCAIRRRYSHLQSK